MIRRALDAEGPVMDFLDKSGQLILLGVLWLICCIPVVTAATATTALYYAVIKSIRRDEGNAFAEFFASFRRNLKRGAWVSITAVVLTALLGWNIVVMLQSGQGGIYAAATAACLAVLAAMLMYICPVLSRFDMGVADAWKLSFVMAVRFLPYTLIMLAGLAVLVWLQIYILPIPTVLVLPGLWCYATTFMVEKALLRYMPPKDEGAEGWYYE